MASGKPLNYTTKVPVHQSVAECQSILAAAGAASVSVHFEDGQPSGLSFTLKTPHGPRNFTLPARVEGVHRVLVKENQAGRLRSDGYKSAGFESRDHAARVAWRVVKDWLEANLALIAAQMATLTEVMLPYLNVEVGGQEMTLFEHYKAQEARALEAGNAGA